MAAWWILAATAAWAGGPKVEIDGTAVRGSVHMVVTPSVVLEALQDPAWEGRIQQSRTETTVTAREGTCHQVAYVVPHPIMTTSYELKRCRVDDGWQVSLVASDSFDRYQARWWAVPEGSGSKVTFQVDLDSSISWVPNSLVRGEMRKSVRKLLAAMSDWADAQAPSPSESPDPSSGRAVP